MLQTVRHFLSLIRFSHTIFALPFALLASGMAWRKSYDEVPWWCGTCAEAFYEAFWSELAGIILCMVFARSAAMAFNRLADRKIDAANPRTAGRHLPVGLLNVGEVLVFAVGSSVAFVASTGLFWPNPWPIYLSVPVLLFLLGYSYAKRFTSFAHFWLGAALALSPIAAWIAIRGLSVEYAPWDPLPAIVLGGAVMTWVAGFDIIYACQDFAYDREARLHSAPVRFGVAGALRLAAACHFATIVLLVCLPLTFPPLGAVWWTGVAAVAGLLLYEHALVRPDDLARVNTAFFNVNAVISLGVLLVGGLDLAI